MQITEMCPNCGSALALGMGVSEVECPHCHLTLEVEINSDDQPDTPPQQSAEDWTNHDVSTQIRIADLDSKNSSTAAPALESTMPSTDTGNLIDSKIAAAAKSKEIKVAKPVQADFITSITEHERLASADALHVVEKEALRLAAETRREAEEAMRAIEEAELAKQKAVEEAENARATAASLKRQQAIASARREAEEKARRVLAEKQSQSKEPARQKALESTELKANDLRQTKIEEAKKKAVEVARQKAVIAAKEKARRKAEAGDKGKNDGTGT